MVLHLRLKPLWSAWGSLNKSQLKMNVPRQPGEWAIALCCQGRPQDSGHGRKETFQGFDRFTDCNKPLEKVWTLLLESHQTVATLRSGCGRQVSDCWLQRTISTSYSPLTTMVNFTTNNMLHPDQLVYSLTCWSYQLIEQSAMFPCMKPPSQKWVWVHRSTS